MGHRAQSRRRCFCELCLLKVGVQSGYDGLRTGLGVGKVWSGDLGMVADPRPSQTQAESWSSPSGLADPLEVSAGVSEVTNQG